MKTVYFIFSSPLQFLFSTLISKKFENNYIIKGYYYNYGKDFSSVYGEISSYLESPFSDINLLSSLDINLVKVEDYIFFGNRFNTNEVSLFYKVKKTTKNIFLYEEGLNTYISHHFENVNLSDTNYKTSIKNSIKILINRLPSLIKLNQFKEIHATFPIEHLKDQSKLQKIEFIQSKSNDSTYVNCCLFLSQTFVEDEFIDEKRYLDFMKIIIDKLSKKYKTIYFKPHPRNKESLIKEIISNNSKIELLPSVFQNIPAEVFLSKNQLDLYSFTSSTLMYASTLFDVNSFQCLDLLIKFQSTPKLENLKKTANLIFAKHNIKSF